MTKSLQEIIDANPEAETFRFGDSPELCAEILALVRSGVKTATCEAASAYGKGKDAWPEKGRRDVALNWDGTPAVMLETVEVLTRRFDEMDQEFVAAQGEFRDLDHWRKGYTAYFKRGGVLTSDGDVQFDSELRGADPAIGYKDNLDILRWLNKAGLTQVDTVEMPANNLAFIAGYPCP